MPENFKHYAKYFKKKIKKCKFIRSYVYNWQNVIKWNCLRNRKF